MTYYQILFDNINSYSGSGLLLVLYFVSLLFLYFKEKDVTKRKMLVVFPVIILVIMFCPLWTIYIRLRNDAVILYRLFWLIPTSVTICYAVVVLIMEMPRKLRTIALGACVVAITICGKYIYANPFFSKAENIYHIPNTVVRICDELIIPGREVRVCFPTEHVQYVRQYTANLVQPYGREILLDGDSEWASDIEIMLSQKVVDSKRLAECLRNSHTQYLVISSDKMLNESLWNYDFCYVTSIDGYDIYLDKKSDLGYPDENDG